MYEMYFIKSIERRKKVKAMWMTMLMTTMYDSDVYTSYDASMSDAGMEMLFGGLMAFMGIVWLISMVIMVVTLIANWKLFKKAGKPGWAALIPIYNTYVLFDIVYPGNGIKFLFLLIPFYNIYVLIKLYIDLSKAFGKEPIFAVGLVFLNVIFTCILGFGSAEYQLGGGVYRTSKPSSQPIQSEMSREDALAKLRANKKEREKQPFEG